jgi:para-nitrobenzyl esterase
MPSNPPPLPERPRAETQAGTVEGSLQGSVEVFLGVPYAAPPVGHLRWRAPEPVAPWQGIRQATAHGASAWQPVAPEGFGPWTREFVVQDRASEDCLYLNIWAPQRESRAALPVLVWIHGGGFFQGSGSVPIYDGLELASQGALVVTINYRLGVLGFFAHPDLIREQGPSGSCNFGLLDQVAALRWVQHNIAAFGGDPNAVTVAGQSAGALSVHMLAASGRTQGLFQRAIALSGPPNLVAVPTTAQAETDARRFASDLEAGDIHMLRAMGVEALTRELPPMPHFMPMVDGTWIDAWPPRAADARRRTLVPMIVGQTADENSGLDPHYGSSDPAHLSALMRRFFGTEAQAWSAHYLKDAKGDTSLAYRKASLDQWIAGLLLWASDRGQDAGAPLFVYQFDHVPPGPQAEQYGAFHTADVPYAFGTLSAGGDRSWTAADQNLSQLMSAYWLNFIRTGNPNGASLPTWSALDLQLARMLRLDVDTAMTDLSPTAAAALAEQLVNPGNATSIFL